MDRVAAFTTLETALAEDRVSAKDKEFVSSLVTQHKSRGLSEKQWYWVTKLAMAVLKAASPDVPLADFAPVYAMFAKAQEHLKHPKVNLSLPSGAGIKLYVSTARSRVPNVLNIVDHDGYQWFGRIYPDGRWEQGTGDPSLVGEVEAMLKRLASSPEEVAAEYGKLTGNCCFCNRSLSDDRSTDVGYGSTCAKRFGLKWGKK